MSFRACVKAKDIQPTPTKSPRTRRPAPRVSPSPPAVSVQRKKTSLYIPRPLWSKKRNREQKVFSKDFPHLLQAPVNGDLHRTAAHAFGLRNLLNGKAQQEVGIDAPPLGGGQMVEGAAQPLDGHGAGHKLLRGRLELADGVFNAVIRVQGVVGLVALGLPPAVELEPLVGHELRRHLIADLDVLVHLVPVKEIPQVDHCHLYVPPFRIFGGSGRVLNGAPAVSGSGGAPAGGWDKVSQGQKDKMRLRDTRPHKRMKRQIHLCTAKFRIHRRTDPVRGTSFF